MDKNSSEKIINQQFEWIEYTENKKQIETEILMNFQNYIVSKQKFKDSLKVCKTNDYLSKEQISSLEKAL